MASQIPWDVAIPSNVGVRMMLGAPHGHHGGHGGGHGGGGWRGGRTYVSDYGYPSDLTYIDEASAISAPPLKKPAAGMRWKVINADGAWRWAEVPIGVSGMGAGFIDKMRMPVTAQGVGAGFIDKMRLRPSHKPASAWAAGINTPNQGVQGGFFDAPTWDPTKFLAVGIAVVLGVSMVKGFKKTRNR